MQSRAFDTAPGTAALQWALCTTTNDPPPAATRSPASRGDGLPRMHHDPHEPSRPAACILVVEDEPALCRLLRRFLEENGYRTLASEDSSGALGIAASTDCPIDLIVCDVMLGNDRGPEVVKRLREIHPDARALLISGFVGADVPPIGDLPLLRKPFSPAELLAEVSRMLADGTSIRRSG